MRVLITGGAGYIGSVLAIEALAKGWKVRVLDTFAFGEESLQGASVEKIKGDIREPGVIEEALEGVDLVIHLAAVVGEPAAKRWPELAWQVNVEGTRVLVERLDGRPVAFASTCSVYGDRGFASEQTPPSPLGLYAESRLRGEEIVSGAEKFLIMRFATVFGLSPRMRFDLMVNHFTKDAFLRGSVEIYNPWVRRPFIHVRDLARAIIHLVEGEFWGEVFNVGSPEGNLTKGELAEIVSGITGARVVSVEGFGDPRDYEVSFEKLLRTGFKPALSVADGVREIWKALKEGKFPNPNEPRYHNHLVRPAA